MHPKKSENGEVDQNLLLSFQSNLLSLISHEVRTPLMGIINSLSLLESDPGVQKIEDSSSVLAMARRNAERLQRTLASLLDLTEIDSGVFKIRMREIRWAKIVEDRVRFRRALLNDQNLKLSIKMQKPDEGFDNPYIPPVFGDPQKLSRAIDLLLEVATSRAKKNSNLTITVEPRRVLLEFSLQPGTEYFWDEAWEEAQRTRPRVAFTGLLQSEEGFVRRAFEGLGSELYLLRQIASAHQGMFLQERRHEEDAESNGQTHAGVSLIFGLPELSHREGLEAVLASRAFRSSSDLTDFALALLVIPRVESHSEIQNQSNSKKTLSRNAQRMAHLMNQARQALYRSTDSIYYLEPQGSTEASLAPCGFLAILLDDCKPEDAEPLLRRIRGKMQGIKGAVTAFPSETQDPSDLFSLTLKKLAK